MLIVTFSLSLTVLFIVLVVIPILQSQPKTQHITVSKIEKKPVIEMDITLDDMILHDMTNEDNTYDIGVIDFND